MGPQAVLFAGVVQVSPEVPAKVYVPGNSPGAAFNEQRTRIWPRILVQSVAALWCDFKGLLLEPSHLKSRPSGLSGLGRKSRNRGPGRTSTHREEVPA